MNSHSHALIAVAAPLISMAAALPQHYATRPVVNNIESFANDQHEVNVKLASLDGTGTSANLTSSPQSKEGASQSGQCATHGDFTYYSERPLPGAEAESILIEECDPSNPNQVRLAYVENKSLQGKLSPTSILIGCTKTSNNSFTARQDGAFNKVAPGTYTNFVRRALAQPTGMKTLAKKPTAVTKARLPKKRSEEDGEEMLVRRWESRSDIDNYSDGYHTCRSANSSACRLIMQKQVCPELEMALKPSLPPVKTEETPLNKRLACAPGLKALNCPTQPAVIPFKKRDLPKEANGDLHAERLSPPNKEKEHNEFMRRWLQGDEHPRSFMDRSEMSNNEETLQKRAMGVEDFHHFRQDLRGESHRFDNDMRRDTYDEDMHGHHEELESCSDFSHRYDPRCAAINRYAGIQQKRDLKGKDADGEMQKRSNYSDKNSIQSYGSRKSLSSRGRYRQRAIDNTVDQTMIKRSADDGQGHGDLLEKRSQYSRHSGNSNSFRGGNRRYRKREVDTKADQSMAKRSIAKDGQGDSMDKRSRYSRNSGNSLSSRGRYRQRAIDEIADQVMIKRDIGDDAEGDLMEKRSRHGRGGRSRSTHHRRDLKGEDNDDILEKRSNHSGRGRRSRSWHRRDVQGDGEGDALEKRSHHNGRGRSYSPDHYRRGLEQEDDAVLEKRSMHSGRSINSGRSNSPGHYRRNLAGGEADKLEKRGRDQDYRRDVQEEQGGALLRKRSHSRGGQGNRNRSNNRNGRGGRSHSRREMNVDIDVGVLGKRDELAARNFVDLDDDGFTVRSALSEHGDIFERGQDSFTDLLGKRGQTFDDATMPKRLVVGRDVVQDINKRDLATSIWKMTVAPLLQRREVASSATIFKRDII